MASSDPLITETAGRSARGETRAAAAAMLLFLAWLFLPLVFGWTGTASRHAPSRALEVVQRPALGGRPLADYLRDFSLYYEKSNPIRPLLLAWYVAFMLRTLGMSSVSTVIVGRENWLFIGHENEGIDELRYFLGCNPLGEAELERWLHVLTERQRWLARRGVEYLLVIAPNKSTVYPEYLPAIYPRGRRTRLDQLSEFMERHAPGFPLLDLRPVMKSGKKARLLYWTADSHWNDFGKHLAYREIVRRLALRFPSLRALTPDAFEVQPCADPPHDLEDLLLLPCKSKVPLFRLLPKRPLPAARIWSSKADAVVFTEVYRSRIASLPLAVIVHDSFGESLKRILSCHFRRSRWLLDRSHAFPSAWIDRKKPDVFIDEIAERYLEGDPWTNPAAIRK
jgi:hypothetical protein